MKKYKAVKGLTRNGRKGYPAKTFQPGDTVSDNDFPKSVIKNWIKLGIVKKVKPNPKEKEIDMDDLLELPDDELHIEEGK